MMGAAYKNAAAVLLCLAMGEVAAAQGSHVVKSKIYAGTGAGFAERLTIAAGDLDGDGDSDLVCGYAGGGLMYLRNPAAKLAIAPPSATVLSGADIGFSARDAGEAPVAWRFIRNASGGSVDGLTGLYTAGPTSGCIDIVEGVDPAAALRGRAYVNVIGEDDAARAGKAIILAGRRGADDPLWPTTDYLANLAYKPLLYRGFAKDGLHYLSAVAGADVDGNGLDDDVAGVASVAAAANAFTNWASRPDRLFVYLVDHGADDDGDGRFRINENEVLAAAQLDGWLDAIQDRHTNDVVVVLDFCQAGSFLDELTYTGPARRVVLAACGSAEATYFVAGGLVSFSDALFTGILMGLDVGESFGLAREAMSLYQSAALDADGSGAYEPGIDEPLAADIGVGASFVAGKDVPQIGSVLPPLTLAGVDRAGLWAGDLTATYPIDRVWCMVVPPGHNPDPADPVGDLPALELAFNPATQRYEAEYAGFSLPGTFKLVFYARDIWGSVSLPRASYVTQNGFEERVIVMTGGATNSAAWAGIDALGRFAYHTFRGRWFDPDAIYYMSAAGWQDGDGDGTNDVDAVSSASNLCQAVTQWAAGADKLTVCLLGEGVNGAFLPDGTQSLAPAVLDEWLDAFQTNGAAAIVLLDYSGSGAAVPVLLPPAAGGTRVVVTGAKAGQDCLLANDGLVSFSSYFLADVFSGYDVRAAFGRARQAIRFASGLLRQESLLEDNGDGVADKYDGAVARQQYIGTAFMTGADQPIITAVAPPAVVEPGAPCLLWASGITDADGVSNVWCLVTAPSYNGVGDLPRLELAWEASRGRHETLWSGFTEPGTYVITYGAADAAGELSAPVQSTVMLADAWEPDDGRGSASVLAMGSEQSHNLHVALDEDWARFYAPSGYPVHVEAEQVGENSDLKLEIFFEGPDGTASNVAVRDDWGVGAGEAEGETLSFSGPGALPAGFYAVRVSGADTNRYGAGSEYELRAYITVGAGALIVVAADKLRPGQPPPEAVVVVDGVTTQAFGGASSLLLNLGDGVHTVSVPVVNGYMPEEDPALTGQVANADSYLYGNPKRSLVGGGTPGVAVFQFVPVVRAEGLVWDALTHGWVEGARLAFRARDGVVSNQVYDGYPANAAYKSAWVTGPDGAFPSNVWLPAVSWDLAVTNAGYTDAVRSPVFGALAAGTVTNVGTVWLGPVDANGDGVSDAWAAEHVVSGNLWTNDTDGDAATDGAEYLAGTDPRRRESVLRAAAAAGSDPGGLVLRWVSAGGRAYAVEGSPVLGAEPWPQAWGPWTAAPGQTNMEWTAPAGAGATGAFYRVRLQAP